MITRARVIGTQFPELSESTHFLQERIQNFLQTKDGLENPPEDTSITVSKIRKDPSVESIETQIAPDSQRITHFLTTYLTWITRV